MNSLEFCIKKIKKIKKQLHNTSMPSYALFRMGGGQGQRHSELVKVKRRYSQHIFKIALSL